MSDVQTEPKRRGRPRKQDANLSQRNGRIQVQGRGGEVLSRKRTGNTDPYAIPLQIIPDGWEYQWNTYTVAGQQQVDAQILMAENGWRPVPAERHSGMFMPEGHVGQILRGGLRLEERPKSLSDEAREEEFKKARSQVLDQNAQLGLGRLVRRDGGQIDLGHGHEARTFLDGGRGVKTSQDAARDAPRPRLEIDQ